MCKFQSNAYKKIHIFASRKEEEGIDGWIRLSTPGREAMEVHLGLNLYQQICLPIQPEIVYEMKKSDNVKIAQMYLSDGPNPMEQGVMFLNPEDGSYVELERWHDTPWREQYHFVPFVNWVNDPNGLCWYDGFYHLFFQSNPFFQEWGDMYWGHAVSKDLMHWVCQPHVLEPQPELWKDSHRKGGAFSGSALVKEDGIHLFFTRHDGPLEDGDTTREWQAHALCRDGICMEREVELIAQKPDGVAFDFRDPKVEFFGDQLYMVVGATLNQVPSILLYQQKKNMEWEYTGPLLQEKTPGIRTIECPDFFCVDGYAVAVGAWMCHYDREGRYQMTRCYIGSFDGKQLHVKQEQWFDFGSNFYAVQSFTHQERRIAIGWISDFLGEHRNEKNGACGSFSLPREVHVRDGRLFLTPAEEVRELIEKTLMECKNESFVEMTQIPGNSYHVEMSLEGEGDFTILLAKDGDETLTLERKDGITGLVSQKEKAKEIRFLADVSRVEEIEIFVDRRVTEVFLNRGEAVGTKVFYQESKDGCFLARIWEGTMKKVKISQMKSIWRKK